MVSDCVLNILWTKLCVLSYYTTIANLLKHLNVYAVYEISNVYDRCVPCHRRRFHLIVECRSCSCIAIVKWLILSRKLLTSKELYLYLGHITPNNFLLWFHVSPTIVQLSNHFKDRTLYIIEKTYLKSVNIIQRKGRHVLCKKR